MVKKNAEKDVGFVRQFNELKKKHPDAVLLFRKGDFYEMYKEDALKASEAGCCVCCSQISVRYLRLK